MGRLDGKVAIITGGARGFGKGACELFAREGAKVFIVDVIPEGEAVAKGIRDTGGQATFMIADVSKREGALATITKAIETYGALDILYNNAGILGPRGVLTVDFTEEDARRLFEVNFLGTLLPTQCALPEMIKRGGGVIISTGSESAYRGNTGFCVYGPSKAAVMNFSKVVAMEYAAHNIRSNTLSPGAGKTPMHNDLYDDDPNSLWNQVEQMIPQKRPAYPEDVAKVALFLASDDAGHVTGTDVLVDGGWIAKGYF
jgi:NAD(P)-dependent dehydrogenase (short-subunit alcohol dehydrogenase family)